MTPAPLAPLAALRQFIVVAVPSKIPVDTRTNPATVGANAHDPTLWLTYGQAEAIVQAWGSSGYGIGFVITAADPFWCLDIDGALQADGQWSPLALELCAALPGTVVEVSYSGRGLHIWGRGPIPEHRKKNVERHIELYSSARFILIGTGQVGEMAPACPGIAAVVERYFKPDAPSLAGGHSGEGPRPDWRGPVDDADLLRRALQSRSAANVFGGRAHASFADLWERNAEVLARAYPGNDGGYDESSADAALASHLAFWTGCDEPRIERLMRASGLARDKYDRPDYLPRTIRGACARCETVCQDKPTAFEQTAGTTSAAALVAGSPVAAPAAPSPTLQSSSTLETPPGPAPGPAEPLRVSGSAFVNAAMQAQMFAGCVYVQDQHRVLVPGGQLLKPDQFKARFGGYVFVLDDANEKTTRDAWEAFTQSQSLRWPRADSTTFDPRLAPGTIVEDCGQTRVNVYWPVPVVRRKGDVTPFLRHLSNLLPNGRDAEIALAYLSACVQYPGVKFQWAPLFVGCEGNGKTLLSIVTANAVGERYVHWPAAHKLDGNFNGWLYQTLLVCIEDVYTPAHKVDLLEKLKPMITASRGYEIEKKGVDQFSARLCNNWILNSNHPDALKKTRNDRRFCHFHTAQMSYDDLVRDGMHGDYMRGMYEWLDHRGGMPVVADFLASVPIPEEFDPTRGAPRAPVTTSTDAAIAASLGPAEQDILERIAAEELGFRGGWVSSHYLHQALVSSRRDGAIPPAKRRGMMQALGYDWHPALVNGRTNNLVLPDGVKSVLYVRQGHEALQLKQHMDVVRAYQRAQGVI